MKFKVTMKDPDTLYDSIVDAVKKEISIISDVDERQAVQQVRVDKINLLCSQWFEYGEYLTVEIDTDAGTCTVCKSGRR